ncbi:MAG: HU family DNA-binding protein [Fidelibacterota bacterium]|nr:MAG: HU family DNA-binding protein [Candidatus Neomarinimicrobiota bacterium]
MTHTELVQSLARSLDLSQRQAHDLLKATVDTLRDTLSHQTGVTIPELGTFGTHVRREHKAYNPFEKRMVILPTRRVVSFHPSTGLKGDVRDAEVTG